MVVRTIYSKRSAFTLIEVIFAIVIIAIAVLSLPMMSRATQRGIESNIVQEAIFAASAELMGATSGYWDENSMQDSAFSNLSRVINIGGDCNIATQLRPGHINQIYHRRCLDNNNTVAQNAPGGTFFDLNDAAHGEQNIFIDTTIDPTGYKKTYTSVVAVGISPTNNNVKDITVTVSDADGIITVLKSQSANVGEIDYYKRMF